MELRYDVYMGDERVGRLDLRAVGLYYHIGCCCHLKNEGMQELWANTDHGSEKVGLLIPDASGCGINTKIPQKRLGQGKVEFFVLPRRAEQGGCIEVLNPDVPFACVKDLAEGRFVRHGDEAVILFDDEK